MFTFHTETNKQDCKWCEPYHRKTVFIKAFFALDVLYSLRSIHTFNDSLIHPSIHPLHSFLTLTTGPQPIRKRIIYRVRSSASSSHLRHTLVPLRSTSSNLRLLSSLPVTSSFYLFFNSVFQKEVPTKGVENFNFIQTHMKNSDFLDLQTISSITCGPLTPNFTQIRK